MDEVALPDYILRLRRNLLALSFFVLFYKYSGAKFVGTVFGFNIVNIDINFLHKCAFYYLLYQLVYFSFYIIHYIIIVHIKFLKIRVMEWDDQIYKTDYELEYEETQSTEFPTDYLIYYDKMLRYITLFKVIVIFSLMECIFPIVTSLYALILLW